MFIKKVRSQGATKAGTQQVLLPAFPLALLLAVTPYAVHLLLPPPHDPDKKVLRINQHDECCPGRTPTRRVDVHLSTGSENHWDK